MHRWASHVLAAIRERVANGLVRFTLKALQELADLDAHLDERDVYDILVGLAPKDAVDRRRSTATHEWMYIFKPRVGTSIVYLKLIVRTSCIVISCHDDDQA